MIVKYFKDTDTALLEFSAAPVDETLAPEPVRVDPERAWEAMRRDKKAAGGRIRLVLLDAPGRPRWPAEVPEPDVRRALEGIIAR